MSQLEDKRRKFNIPPIPYLPAGKRVIVWRLPSEQRTAGGLFVPESHATVKSRGILLAAGLAARDVLKDALVEIGDEVYFGRFAGVERDVERKEASTQPTLLEMAVEDVGGSVEAIARLEGYRVAYDEELGEHWYEEINPKRKVA